ncbi:Uncharacterized conserved protein YaaN involved in tellurite resistance [Loktanella atrilutea]|uniref:Uncharacterized conserved protein YaaN involved in tellurite resistance n=1 Tax=Loktanella atrilutea TaxID=366533 RepID=A0A1M5BNS2_LOKAT|nr:toxic anion resistance protein [Loktanella atrilutea]SHF43877.1 Uncharacterized conserved protein YaaN involved in tellurite resistance [Loktanella atrilutea]
MADKTRDRAQATLAEVERMTAVVLPEPAGDAVTLETADRSTSEAITRRMAEIDLTDTNSIVKFGTAAQSGLQQISQDMLAGVRNKDVGPAGDSLRSIVSTIRGFSANELNPEAKRGWFDKLLGRATPLSKFVARFEDVQTQIDKITDDLLGHETTLMKDIESLDRLYAKTLAFYDELGLYIAAGEARLARIDAEEIPAKEREAAASSEGDGVMEAQELRDLRTARDDLERRVHDLKLTRQVTMQSLPSIRLVQENDKSLVTKINSTLLNTVPLWENQLAQALTIQRSAEAAGAVREASDLTNDLLRANAKNLRDSNTAIRTEVERGAFDIAAIQAANADLIATIDESLAIADEGKRKRAAAEEELQRMEGDLKATLSAAKSRTTPAGTA